MAASRKDKTQEEEALKKRIAHLKKQKVGLIVTTWYTFPGYKTIQMHVRVLDIYAVEQHQKNRDPFQLIMVKVEVTETIGIASGNGKKILRPHHIGEIPYHRLFPQQR